MSDSTPTPRHQHRPLWRRALRSPWMHLIAAILLIGLVQGFIVKLYTVPSVSMQPTLEAGDRILANRLAYLTGEPQRGDVIVFTASVTWHPSAPSDDSALETALRWVGGFIGIGPGTEHTLVKRIIASSGDTLECCDQQGRLLVNGNPIDEPYVQHPLPYTSGTLDCDSQPASPRCLSRYTVPDGQYVVLGDNRANSRDSLSNCRGLPPGTTCRVATVQRDDIIGEAFTILWPLNRWGGID